MLQGIWNQNVACVAMGRFCNKIAEILLQNTHETELFAICWRYWKYVATCAFDFKPRLKAQPYIETFYNKLTTMLQESWICCEVVAEIKTVLAPQQVYNKFTASGTSSKQSILWKRFMSSAKQVYNLDKMFTTSSAIEKNPELSQRYNKPMIYSLKNNAILPTRPRFQQQLYDNLQQVHNTCRTSSQHLKQVRNSLSVGKKFLCQVQNKSTTPTCSRHAHRNTSRTEIQHTNN